MSLFTAHRVDVSSSLGITKRCDRLIRKELCGRWKTSKYDNSSATGQVHSTGDQEEFCVAGVRCGTAMSSSTNNLTPARGTCCLSISSDLISIHSTFGQRKQQWMSENGYLYECLMNALTETEDSD